MFVLVLLIACAIRANAYERNGIRLVKDYVLDKAPIERQLFQLKRNGFKVDARVVSSFRNDTKSNEDNDDDNFPEFPARDIGKCILEFSLGCIRKRFVRFLQTIGRLDEISLLGQDVKLIRSKVPSGGRRSDSARAMNDSDLSIEHTLDDFFDSFVLRITLPRWNRKWEKNQIDVMLDETAVEGKRIGGGGGGGGGSCGKGGKCKMMMMGMLMMIKMKLFGLLALKGMMMGGASMMMLLMQKLGKGGNPWQSSGPWKGGGGGQLKEIVLVTKSSSGSSGGGCCGSSDSYGPPSSSYGPPSGGGGWGRSFQKRPMTLSYDGRIETANGSNRTLMIGEASSKADNVNYPDYQDYEGPIRTAKASSDLTTSRNATSNIAFYEYGDNNVNSMESDSRLEAMTNPKNGSREAFKNLSDVTTDIGSERGADWTTSRSDSIGDANSAYTDEWQATAARTSPSDVSLSRPNARIELRRPESRSRDVPLLRGV